jgi:hypothetical protein
LTLLYFFLRFILKMSDKNSTQFVSQLEIEILRSETPIEITETEEITVLGHQGIWLNKSEQVNWKGSLPINDYIINEDKNPEIIIKNSKKQLEYIQELAIRYLKPPTPPAPGT